MEHERTRLTLDAITIPIACPKRWDEIEGGGLRRWCEECRFHVTDLSALTRTEGEAFLAASTGRTCVTYLHRADGSIVTRSERRRFALSSWARIAAGFLALVAFLPGCRRTVGRVTGVSSPDANDVRTVGDMRAVGTPAPLDPPVRALGEMVMPEPTVEPEGLAPGGELPTSAEPAPK